MVYRPTAKTEQKKEEMRQRLLAAARDLFSRQGYEATTLQQIVKEASTSIGNCYFYFPNKEAILFAIADDLRTEIARRVDAAVEALPLGPELIAVAIYEGTLAVIENAAVAHFALSDSTHPGLRQLTMELFASRLRHAFASMPELYVASNELTVQMAALAYHGAISCVLEEIVAGRVQAEAAQAARFLTTWNLNALGFPSEIVQQSDQMLVNRNLAGH